MAQVDVAVVRTGVANLASVTAALRRAGARPYLADQVGSVDRAQRVVLPGVGSFGAAMASLARRALVEPIARRIREGRPMLAICLGLQLLSEGSEESPDVAGLGVIRGRAQRFVADVRVPQMGWNAIDASPRCWLLASGYAYFANSYRLVEPPVGWEVARADHGGAYVAAIERGALLACQFHPELSGPWGTALIRRWLQSTEAEVSPC